MKTPEIVLDDWQKEALEHRGDMLLCTGRQIGKTYILARKACMRMIEKPKTEIIICSLSEDQAKLIIRMILIYLEENYKKLIAKGKSKPTLNKINLTNGSFALARPVGMTGDAVRGFTGNVLILDEGSRFPELAFTAAEPTLLSTGGEVWMASTPYGKKGYFWDQYNSVMKEDDTDDENDMGWKVIYVNGEEAIKNRKVSPSWTEEKRERAIKRLEKLKKRWSTLRYGQEILAKFLDDLQQFFSDELLHKRLILKKPETYKKENNYLGVDIARLGGDECAYAIIQRNNEQFRQIENITKKEQLTTQTEQDILYLNTQYNPDKIGIDAGSGSLGVGIFDQLLKNPKTKRKVIAMNNRSISQDRDGKSKQRMKKEDYYDNLRSMLEQGELLLLDDDKIFQSLKSIQWEFIEKDGNTKVRIWGSDSHIAEALIRAAELAKRERIKNINIYYI